MKQLDVSIMGQSYLLSCPDGGEARLHSAAARVDGAMCKIRDAGKVRARDRIAVLAALNLAFDLDQASAQTAAQTASARPLNGAHAAHHDSADLTAADAQRLSSLVARLDAALGVDGQLL